MHFSSNALQDVIMLESQNLQMSQQSNTSSFVQWNTCTVAKRDELVQRILQTNYDQLKRDSVSEQERANKRCKVSG
jgi:hypothetical protein